MLDEIRSYKNNSLIIKNDNIEGISTLDLKIMKRRLLALFIVSILLCLCVVTPAMASTEEAEKDVAQLKLEEFEAEMGEEAMQEVEDYLALQASLPTVVKVMPYSGLAFAATKPKSQAIKMKYIDNFDVSEEEKERYKTGLQDIWDRYPFNITKDDYPFMAELGPMIEEEAFRTYNPEEVEKEGTGNINDISSQSVSNQYEQKIAPGFTGMLAAVIVMLCFYFVRK